MEVNVVITTVQDTMKAILTPMILMTESLKSTDAKMNVAHFINVEMDSSLVMKDVMMETEQEEMVAQCTACMLNRGGNAL
jgi:hypothetical protein